MKKILTLTLLLSFTILTAQDFNKKEAKENNTNTTTLNRLPPGEGISDNNGDFIELEPIDGGEPSSPTPLTPTLGSGEVGSINGELSVSKTGGAVYTIPIEVPPGINGVEPKISLNYNSQSGDGVAGWGWNIGGISKITRVSSTNYHDGEIENYSRFSLDGQRLILKSGIYGQPGSTYETENYSNIIVHYNYTNNNPTIAPTFKVEYPDGSYAIYGVENTATNFIETAIKYWVNPQGLRINYHYEIINNVLYIKSINYGTNDDVGINVINFEYKTKNIQNISYFFGSELINTKILSTIKITGNGVPHKNYYLTHDLTSTGYERLKSIKETTGDSSKQLNPISFTYKTNQTLISDMPNIEFYNKGLPFYNDNLNTKHSLGDIDGDGKLDFIKTNNITNIISLETINDNNTTTPYYNGNLNNLYNSQIIKTLGNDGFSNKDLLIRSFGWVLDSTTNKKYTKWDLIEYNDNELNNIRSIYTEKLETNFDGVETFGRLRDYGKGYKKTLYGDFDGDKISDIIEIYNENENGFASTFFCSTNPNLNNYSNDSGSIDVGNSTYTFTPNEFNGELNITGNSIIDVGDYNADGKTDLFVFKGNPYNKIDVYTFTNNQFTLATTYNYNLPGYLGDTFIRTGYICGAVKFKIFLNDFNGDGKTDIFLPTHAKILYSNGVSFQEKVIDDNDILPSPELTETYFVGDFNNDKVNDIIKLKPILEHEPFTSNIQIITSINWSNSQYQTQNVTVNGYKYNYGIDIKVFQNSLQSGQWSKGTYSKILKREFGGLDTNQNDDNKFNQRMLPILIKNHENLSYSEFALMGGIGTSYFKIYFSHNDDQTLLTEVNNNGIRKQITYNNLINANGTYTTSDDLVEYPYYNMLNNKDYKIVSEIREIASGPNTPLKRKQFKYHGAIFDTAGRGISGFQATTTTNWFNQTDEIISTINKYDFTKNGANTETFSMVGLIEPNYNLLSTDSFIARTLNTYNHEDTGYVNPLQSNKVFKLFKTKTQSFNGLTGTSSITNVNYNNYNNPINSTTVIKNGATIEKTTTNTFNYDAAISTPYIVDRLNSKTSSTTVQPSGDVYTSEEQYVYDLNLLKQIKKRTTNSGQTSDFITESNEYDSYGNLIQKKFTAPGMADRVTNYEYDTQTHRFITKKIDTELQETVYEYNQNTGLLLSETAPSISGYPLKTTYTYDKWGKVTKITDYLGKLSNVSYSNLVNNSGVLKTVTNSDGSSTKTITDVYGRVLHEGYKTIENKWSVKSTLYNIYDQPIKVTANYFDGDNAEVWNEMQYDIYGRLTQSNHLKTASSPGKVTTYNYNGLTTIENDGLKTTTSIKNAIGQVISLEDSPGEIVTYQYFANGNLKKAITSGSTIEIQQDAFGRKKTLIDPSAGTRNYEYNKFGELTKEEIVGKGFTEFILDNTGKLLEKKITEAGTLKSNATYSYNGNKQLATITFNDYENSKTINYSYNYDNYKRLNFKDESGYQSYFQQAISYDAFGRPEKQLYTAVNTADGKSSSKWIKTEYKNGFSWKMYDMLDSSTPGVLLWETKEVNENGDITAATLNNNALLLNKTFDVYGFPTQIKYSNDLSDYMVQDTEFDPVYGNLTKRTSNLFGATWTEDLSYDSLDRLITWKDNEGIQNQSYNGNGSINSNKIGSYAYTIANKPFQISTITPQYPSAVFDYYANREQNISYNINKKPVKITELNAENIDFEYNPMDSRSVMFYGNLEANKNDRIFRKYYSADGSMEIKRNLNTNQVEFITYVQGSPYNSSMVLKSDGTNQEYLYLLKDYQGTINGIVNTAGNLIEKRQFDVWGALINFANASGVTTVPTTANSMLLDRGYTGHEHLLGVNIINMNGRIYDHNLHKFLQPDNNIQDFYNTQNYNRYGYVLNNPTKYTDESGEFWQYIAAAIFNAYAAGYQSSGDYNPFNWDSTAWTNAGLGAASFGASTAATYYADNYISNYGNNNVEFTSQDNYEGNNYSNIDTNFGFANNEVSIWDDSQEIFGNSIQDPINFSGGKYNGFSPFTIPDKNNFNGFTLEYRKTTQLSHIESYNLFSNVFDKRTSMFDKIMSYTDKTGYIPGLNFKSLKSDLKNLNPYKLSAQALIEYSKWKIADVSSQNEQIFKNYIGLHLNNPSNLKGMYQVYERNGYTIYEDVTVYYYDVSTGKYLGKVD